MKKAALLLSMFFIASAFSAQTKDPVTWTGKYIATSASEGELVITATIEKGWHIYSTRPTDAGPVPTSFTIASSPKYDITGKPEEIGAHEEFDKAFEAKIFSFDHKAEFRQKMHLKSKTAVTIPVKLEYMSCNDMMCLPPKIVDLVVKTQ